MAESELSITYADLLAEVASFLGYAVPPIGPQLVECDRHVQAGLRRFYSPPAVQGAQAGYPWSFLSPVATILTIAGQEAQDLPGDLGRVLGQLHYSSDQHRCSVKQVSEDEFQGRKSRGVGGGAPVVACVRHKAKLPGTGQRLEIAWWPAPDAAYTLTFKYEAFNGKLSDDNRYPLGGMRYAELLTESCLAAAELRSNDDRGIHRAEFESLLVAAIEQDRRVGAQFHGAMGDMTERESTLPRRGDTGSTYPITYNGVAL